MVAHFAPVNVRLRGGDAGRKEKIHWMKVFVSSPSITRRKQRMWQAGAVRLAIAVLPAVPLVGLLKMQTMRRRRRRRRRRRDSLKKKKAIRVVYRGDIWKKKKKRTSAWTALKRKRRKERVFAIVKSNRRRKNLGRVFPSCRIVTLSFPSYILEKFKDSRCRLFQYEYFSRPRWGHDSQSNEKIG